MTDLANSIGPDPYVATFSIAAVDRVTGDVGVAVASKFLAVGNIVPWAEPGVGAVATQALANAGYGRAGLALMRAGLSASDALARLLAEDPDADRRQVGLVGIDGSVAAHTGVRCSAWAGHRTGTDFTCQGNILAGPEVPDAMAGAFVGTAGVLADRLFAALRAGDAAGGDRRGRQSAAIYVLRAGGGYQGLSDVVADLRVDDSVDPIHELGRLLELNNLYFGKSPPSERLSLRGPALESLAHLMARAGKPLAEGATIDDPAVIRALDSFLGSENLEDRVDLARLTIDPPALAHLSRIYGDG